MKAKETMTKRFKSLKNLINIILNFKNWPTYIVEHFGLIKNKYTTYHLRNGLNYKVRTGTFDRGIIGEVCVDKIYTPDGFEIKDSDLVIDIGAQIGVFSVFAAKLASNGKVFSFEPVPENFSLLKENVQINKLTNVSLFNMAVSNIGDKKEMFLDESNTGGHSIYKRAEKENKIVVNSVNFDKWIDENNIKKINFLKIDCEGAEYEILSNLSDDKFEMIKRISMEYHYINEVYNVDYLKKLLTKNGFDYSIVGSMLYALKK